MRTITLGLGPGGSHLSGRTLVVRDVSTDPPTTIDTQSLAGTDETADVEVEDDGIFEATLVDVCGSVTGKQTVIKFSTSEAAFQSGQLSVLAFDEMSESSASSLSSLSTSSSSQTMSESSQSTLSSSSLSTISSSSTSTLSVSSSSSSSSTSSLSSSSVSSSSESSSSS